jgi:hypothetical protein
MVLAVSQIHLDQNRAQLHGQGRDESRGHHHRSTRLRRCVDTRFLFRLVLSSHSMPEHYKCITLFSELVHKPVETA